MLSERSPHEWLLEGIRIAGSQTAFANMVEVKQPSVSGWVSAKNGLPVKYVVKAEAGTGIPRWRYRPDFYSEDTAGFDHLEGLRA